MGISLVRHSMDYSPFAPEERLKKVLFDVTLLAGSSFLVSRTTRWAPGLELIGVINALLINSPIGKFENKRSAAGILLIHLLATPYLAKAIGYPIGIKEVLSGTLLNLAVKVAMYTAFRKTEFPREIQTLSTVVNTEKSVTLTLDVCREIFSYLGKDNYRLRETCKIFNRLVEIHFLPNLYFPKVWGGIQTIFKSQRTLDYYQIESIKAHLYPALLKYGKKEAIDEVMLDNRWKYNEIDLIYLYVIQGQIDKAQTLLSQESPTLKSSALREMALAHIKRKELDEANKILKKKELKDQHKSEVLQALALAHIEREDFVNAEAILDLPVLEEWHKNVIAKNLALAYIANKNLEEAKQLLESGKLDEYNEDGICALIVHAYIQENKQEEAEKYISDTLNSGHAGRQKESLSFYLDAIRSYHPVLKNLGEKMVRYCLDTALNRYCISNPSTSTELIEEKWRHVTIGEVLTKNGDFESHVKAIEFIFGMSQEEDKGLFLSAN